MTCYMYKGDAFVKATVLRESSFNMTRGDEDIEGGSKNFWTPERGALKKFGSAPKICIL